LNSICAEKNIKIDPDLVKNATTDDSTKPTILMTFETLKKKTGTGSEAFGYDIYPNEAFYTQWFHKMRVAAMKIQS